MITYFVYIIVFIILFFVIIIASKAVQRGMNAKSEQDVNFEENQKKQISQNEQVDSNNISEELLKIKSLHEEGSLTEKEYEKAKKKILD